MTPEKACPFLGTQLRNWEGAHRRTTAMVEMEVLNLAQGKIGWSNRL